MTENSENKLWSLFYFEAFKCRLYCRIFQNLLNTCGGLIYLILVFLPTLFFFFFFKNPSALMGELGSPVPHGFTPNLKIESSLVRSPLGPIRVRPRPFSLKA